MQGPTNTSPASTTIPDSKTQDAMSLKKTKHVVPICSLLMAIGLGFLPLAA
jgi:hypothetical protein